MIGIREVVIVEGRYDKNALLQCVDCTVIETGGFGIFNDKEKQALLRRLARERGLIVLTDSDGAGFVIRNKLRSVVGPGLKHAYIPDVPGREKRKRRASREGKLGVEGMDPQVLVDALLNAGATVTDGSVSPRRSAGITKADLYELGLSGRPDSRRRRAELLKALDLPERMTTNALLGAVNLLYAREEFLETARAAAGDAPQAL